MTSGAGASAGAAPRLVYLYGFVEAGVAGDVNALDVSGVHPDADVRAVTADEVAAVVSDVPADEFSEDALARRLNDLTSLEELARGHERVVDALVARATVLPARMATLYRSDEDVRSLVTEREAALARALRRLDGAREWGVKVLIRRERVLERLEADPSAARAPQRGPASPGAAYFAERRREQELEEGMRRETLERAEEVHGELQAVAARSALVAVRAALPGEDEGGVALNAAYLVARDREEDFRRAVADLARRLEHSGFAVTATGPWPPYNFVDEATA